ncbi:MULTISPECIES: peptidase domain-containing ABC transporter [unclassified Stenotrophomonas]|uniref:peptidase domain-containing ABC transporter n=1 Tax=unclassified Stenotrophomonas TaxID=196198 RepID=UPI00244ACACA|nr:MULTISPECIES: peptidase domain-containing ABC transporter [unclassified Stenotrophomonas]MBN5158347.1 peptidase domain-containing ABC transporter [Stenotrophomonas maltophilia]MDG9842373.1 peptidase domain-containing ABC transporter [Stenotrophomonas sp. GD04054]MDH0017863.1 peptidase domain-containing ABC transporter [Stenotrophomonas sp. GD04028]MDH0574882.1 peptidase domain-containing ABC transporter [Stenotrophomonas sp. GD03997]MDH0859180.1 peptidase domain-containing ABC transporter [
MDAIVQSEAAECGLACLAMVASHHGNRIGLRELRRQHSLSLKGATLSQLMDIAAKMGFMCRPLRLDLEHLAELKLPCILHWDLNHFVVLTRVHKRHVTVLDPALGKRVLAWADFSQHFTGIALELSPGADMRPSAPPPAIAISQLTGRVSGLWRALGLILLLSLALQVFVLLAPFFMQWVVDQVLIAADRDLLTVLGIGFGFALLLQIGIGVVRGWAVIHLSNRLGLQWTGNVFSHLIRLPVDFYEKRHLGDITSRMGSVQAIQRTLTTSFVEALIDGVMAIVTLGMMLLYSWKLALVTLLAVGLYLSARALAFRAFRNGTERQLIASAHQQSHLMESIRGVQSIKIAGRETLRSSGYYNLMNETINRDVWLARFGLAFNSTSQLIFGMERIAVVWIGAVLAMQNIFSVGMLIAYLAYKDQFAQRIGGLIDKWMEFRMLRLHGERLSDIVLTEPEATGERSCGQDLPAELRIEVEGLGFRYASGEPWVLRNCNLTIGPGESVAIIGASGCGKTTLLKLLLGLLTPTEGQIRIGGIPMHKIGMEHYRRVIGAVMQDDQLFAGSISDNISFENENIDEDRIMEAARLAAVHDDIAAMPMGYNSLIADMGTSLSGGQKQRVILARALYRKPQLLFLDEATSHLDVERERLVNDAVRQLDLTRVIIAHRPETIASADRVLVMHAGAIVRELCSSTSRECEQSVTTEVLA